MLGPNCMGAINTEATPFTDQDSMRVEFIPGQTVPLFELKPPVFEGLDFGYYDTAAP